MKMQDPKPLDDIGLSDNYYEPLGCLVIQGAPLASARMHRLHLRSGANKRVNFRLHHSLHVQSVNPESPAFTGGLSELSNCVCDHYMGMITRRRTLVTVCEHPPALLVI
jgi:hypothetical protein